MHPNICIKDPLTNKYLATEMRLVDKASDQLTICGWNKGLRIINYPYEAKICAVPLYPPTRSLIFKIDPTAKRSVPVFVKDDPEIVDNDIKMPELEKSYTGNHVNL